MPPVPMPIGTAAFCLNNERKALLEKQPERNLTGGSMALSTMNGLSQQKNLGALATMAGKATQAANDIGKHVFEIDKIAEKASGVVNPLLCLASGVRILRDDDSMTASAEELSAMSLMFGGETAYKGFRRPMEGLVRQGAGNIDADVLAKDLQASSEAAQKTANRLNRVLEKGTNGISGAILKNNTLKDFYTETAKKIAGMSSGKQKALFVAAELGFVATSIIAFTIGRKIGCWFTGRGSDKEEDASGNPFGANLAYT